MSGKARTPEQTYGPALHEARRSFLLSDPVRAAHRSAVAYQPSDSQSGLFTVPFWGTTVSVSWPDGAVQRTDDRQPVDITTHLLVLHYLLTADGTPMGSQWIAFRSLPGGLGYDAAFRARSSLRLAEAFGTDRAAFEAACCTLGGERLTFGDASFMFRVLPRMWLAVVVYLADEEFSPEANVLFDSSASHYLPTEDLAVLGGMAASRLIKAARTG